MSELSFRLPKQIQPYHYDLRMETDMLNSTFSGVVTIRFELLKKISFIPVHAADLKVKTEELCVLAISGETVEGIAPTKCYENTNFQFWVTEFADALEKGSYSIKFSFDGVLNGNFKGFYKSSFKDVETNKNRWLAATYFEPTFARYAFPCFDEPALKAQFDITIVLLRADNYQAISNMPVESTTVLEDKTEWKFAKTPFISTYLTAFVISEFDFKSATISGVLPEEEDINLCIYGFKSKILSTQVALNLVKHLLMFYINYFELKCPIPKLDFVAIPGCTGRTMANWGLIMCRESELFDESLKNSTINKQNIEHVIAHKLAHIWFGSWVSVKWWNSLWLIEGLAQLFQYKSLEKLYPNCNLQEYLSIHEKRKIMILDGSVGSQAIDQSVEDANQISKMLAGIIHSKGAFIISMLENLVGADNFCKLCKSFFTNHLYGNTTANDFLKEIENLKLDFDVKAFIETFTSQFGYPLLKLERKGNRFVVTQKLFLSNLFIKTKGQLDSKFNYAWSLPITYFTDENNEVRRIFFKNTEQSVTIHCSFEQSWIKLNKDQIGYYRVNYDENTWQALIDAVLAHPDQFSAADRVNLLSDAFALADASELEYDVALDLTSILCWEKEYIPWIMGISELLNLKKMLTFTNTYTEFCKFVRSLLKKIYGVVGWKKEDEHSTVSILRKKVLKAACIFGSPEALAEAVERFMEWQENPKFRLPDDIREVVYYFGMQQVSTEESWNKLWQLYIQEENSIEKLLLLRALTATREPWLLQNLIHLAWNEENVCKQNYFAFGSYIAQNPIGRSLFWDYVREQWPVIVDRFTTNEICLGKLLQDIASHFNSQTHLEEMEFFMFKFNAPGVSESACRLAHATIKHNIEWINRNEQKIMDWLKSYDDRLFFSRDFRCNCDIRNASEYIPFVEWKSINQSEDVSGR